MECTVRPKGRQLRLALAPDFSLQGSPSLVSDAGTNYLPILTLSGQLLSGLARKRCGPKTRMLLIRNLAQSPRSAAHPTPSHDHSADFFIDCDAFWRPRSQKRRFDNQLLAGRHFLPLSRQVIFSAPTYPPRRCASSVYSEFGGRSLPGKAASSPRAVPPGPHPWASTRNVPGACTQ